MGGTVITYEQAYEDWDYLWTIYGPAADMTGGYIDQGDLALLLKNPSKITARKCLINQIEYWFSIGTDTCRDPGRGDTRVLDIADRYRLSW